MQTGDKVTWSINGKVRIGIFRQDLGDNAEVICTNFEGTPMAIKTVVSKKLLYLN